MNIKKALKIIKKTICWILGIWISILLILQIIMLPPIFTPLANTLANKFINANVSIGYASGSVFRFFPRISVSLEDLEITYPHERFDSISRTVAQNALLYYGCGEQSDTLASIRRLSASLSLGPLIWGEVKIPDIEIHSPTIYAHSYDEGQANWNIFGSSATSEKPDTTKAKSTPTSSSKSSSGDDGMNIILKKIHITGKPKIVYTDSQDSLFVFVKTKDIRFDGHFETSALHKLMAEAAINNVHINGRYGSDSLSGILNTISLKPHKKHMDLDIKAQVYPQVEQGKLLPVPIDLSGELSLPKDEGTAISLHNLKTSIGTIPGEGSIDVKLRSDSTVVNGHFKIDRHNIQEFVNTYGSLFLPGAEDAKSNTSLYVDARINGAINSVNGTLPELSVKVDIPYSHIDHESFPKRIDLGFEADIKMDRHGQICADIHKSNIQTYGIDFSCTARTYPVGNDDREIIINNDKTYISLESLCKFLPETTNIIADGDLNVKLNGAVKMSDLSIYDFSNMNLNGGIICDNLIFQMPDDSIDVKITSMDIKLKPVYLDTLQLTSIKGGFRSIDAKISDAFEFKGDAIDFTASNSRKGTKEESKEIKYFGGKINAGSLYLMDSDSTCIKLVNTRNKFGIFPNSEDHTIPELALTDTCSSITYLTFDNQVYLKDSKIEVSAEMKPANSTGKRSYAHKARRYPRNRNARKKDEFSSRDIRFNINDVAKKYFKEWELSSNVSTDAGIVNTAQMPFTNVIRGIGFSYQSTGVNKNLDTLTIDTLNVDFFKKDHLKIDYSKVNWHDIDSTKTASGRLEIVSDQLDTSYVSGIRPALLYNTPIIIGMTVRSDFFNADELLTTNNIPNQPETNSLTKTNEHTNTEISTTASSSQLIVIPKNIKAKINIDLNNIKYKGTDISKIKTMINVKDRCAQIIGTEFKSDVGNAYLNAFYVARSKRDIKSGFCLDLEDITCERVIALMPEIGNVIPMIESIKGKVNCEVAATAELDTTMNLKMPTVNGIARFSGANLSISDNEVYTEVARKLFFKNKRKGTIDNLLIESSIQDSKLEIYPFILEIDRYRLGLGGLQNMNKSYQHHISILRSPFMIKFGLNLSGPDYNHMKFKLGKAKYKVGKIESFTQTINKTKGDLNTSIEKIFSVGVDKTIKNSDPQKHIRNYRKEVTYINAATQEMEELSAADHQKLVDMENAEKALEGAMEAAVEAVKKVLDKNQTYEQSGIH